jgi:two-component system, cell cycle sensor histidine kinase and response regulator CckA
VKPKINPNFLAGALGMLLVFFAGLWVLFSTGLRLNQVLTRSSYDSLFDFSMYHRPGIQDSEILIIYMDEASHAELEQPFNAPWDRSIHADLIDVLTLAGAKAVVFDVLFTDPGMDPEADLALAEAIERNGRVILAADYAYGTPVSSSDLLTQTETLTPPYAMFEEKALEWGVAQLKYEPDFTIRQHLHTFSSQNYPSLTWIAAEKLGYPVARSPADRLKERWVNYYGPPLTLPQVSYSYALFGANPDLFRDKIIFIGSRPITGFYGERRDEYRSPHSGWSEPYLFMPAVEVHATMFLNLLRQEWLSRLAPAAEWGILLAVAVVFGFGLPQVRPWTAAGLALLGILAFSHGTFLLFEQKRLWFPWLVVVAVQLPAALLWSMLFKFFEWYLQRRKLERQRSEDAERIREQAALLDKARDAIMVHDLSGNILFWNQSAERLYGWSREEIVHQNVERLLAKRENLKLAEAWKALHEKGDWTGELIQVTRDNQELTVESRWSLVRGADAVPREVLVINTDITERKKLEAQFLRSQRMQSIGTLAGGIAHDLNNVLTPITMAVQMLRVRPHDETILKTVEASARRGAELVKQVLTFARGHDGEKKILQLRHLIKEMERIMIETFPKSIDVNTRIERDLWPVSGDATQLHQVLLNLCVNSRDALPEGGQILIQARNITLDDAAVRAILGARPGNYVQLSVTDDGIGIAPEVMEHIFEPFFTTKEVGKGTGLGLSTVSSIVRSHDGFMDVQSELGRGTTFSVYLPQAHVIDDHAPFSARELFPVGNGELILIVDDEQTIVDMVKSTLVNHGYRVLTAMHGGEAISICSQQNQDIAVAIVDSMMPIMDGPTTIRVMRKLRPEIRFIVISGFMGAETMAQHRELKGLTLLPKPFDVEKLLQSVKHVLRELDSAR